MVAVPQHAKLIKTAAIASVMVAILLVLLKTAIWWLTGSVSLLAGLTDSLLDSLASLLNLIAITIALKPADHNHRFGHGKAEALAGLGQAVFITISALLVGWQGVKHLLQPIPLVNAYWSILVMLFSLVITIALVIFQRYVVKKTASTAITADSLHYKSDILLNISILLALLLSYHGWQQSDAFFGVLIACYILWSAYSVGKEAIAILMDKELPEKVVKQMLALAEAVPDVMGIHDLKTRKSGSHWFVQLHVELPATMSLFKAHQLCLQIRGVIQQQWPQADVIIHADPC